MEGAVKIVAMRCRTADRGPDGARRAAELAEALGARMGREPRLIGSYEQAGPQAWDEDLSDSRGCLLEAGGQVDDALFEDAFPVLLAGDCAIAVTTLPTVARHRPDAKVLWLDAHGDFNTPETSESGYLGGMALAGACGLWPTGFPGRMPPDRVVLCGVHELDDGERTLLERTGATVLGTTLKTLADLEGALDGAPTYVHLDADVLDSLGAEKLLDLLDAVADSCEVVGLEVTGLDAPVAGEEIAGIVDPLLPKELNGVE